MSDNVVGPLEEMLEHIRAALAIYFQHKSALNDKTTRDYLRRSNNRITLRIEREKELSVNAHITHEPFVFVASSIRYGNVDGQRVILSGWNHGEARS